MIFFLSFIGSFFFGALPAFGGQSSYFALEGEALSLVWGVPFVLVLGSLALCPLLCPRFWHRHYGKIISFYSLGIAGPIIFLRGSSAFLSLVAEIVLHHYGPFMVLIMALYVTAGGVVIKIKAPPSPKINTSLLGLATFVAGWIGTTGAAMVFIRPFLALNKDRKHRQHLALFFIILVGNIGGGFTPLGDPPLFLGYLQGVDFFWTLKAMTGPVIFVSVPLLVLFYLWDRHLQEPYTGVKGFSCHVKGYENMTYIGGIIMLILVTSLWKPAPFLSLGSTSLSLNQLVRDGGLILITLASYFKTNPERRKENDFTWAPLQEVAIIFAAIFMTVAPVLEMFQEGKEGPFRTWLSLLQGEGGAPSPSLYFYATGLLSSFLDNAPTYLIFFKMAGGDPYLLMTDLAPILLAISTGAVFMGALTYIGNAPNFMIKAIAESQEIQMPSFFGYAFKAFLILFPILVLMSLFFF